jgi:hypothetical protein
MAGKRTRVHLNFNFFLITLPLNHSGFPRELFPDTFSTLKTKVCDDEWHHYAVNVNFPEVELIVDGDKWIDERDNPEIIDDWPLHPAADITTKITIGACWQG